MGESSTPQPPYFAVIFTSLRTAEEAGYSEMADQMVELAAQQPGFLGMESARSPGGLGITVSYWTSEEAITNWRTNAEHQIAQDLGRKIWYADYQIRIARVERAYRNAPESESLNLGDNRVTGSATTCKPHHD